MAAVGERANSIPNCLEKTAMSFNQEGKIKVYQLAVKYRGEEWEIEDYASKEARNNRIKHLNSMHPQERPSFTYDKDEDNEDT